MRAFLTVLTVFFIILNSCKNSSKSDNSKTSDKTDTIGYFEARDLHGLANFIIDKSSYVETFRTLNKEFKEDKRYDNSSPFNITETIYDTTENFLNKDILERRIFGCPNLKAIKVSTYFIGDIEISNLKLTFYQDTLIRVDCAQNDEIEEGFIAKYGNGKSVDNSLWRTPSGETNERPNDDLIGKSQLLKIDETKTWENKNVIAKSSIYCVYKYDGDKYLGADNSTSIRDFTIVSKHEERNIEMNRCDSLAQEYKLILIESKKRKDFEKL
jgi:hypothetical protein